MPFTLGGIFNRNKSTGQAMRKTIRAENLQEQIPDRVAPHIVMVSDINPDHNRIISIVRAGIQTTNTDVIIMTTDANRDFILKGFTLSAANAALADQTIITITAVINGLRVILTGVGTSATEVGGSNISLAFTNPMLLDRGTTVLLESNASAGALANVASVHGYIIDD